MVSRSTDCEKILRAKLRSKAHNSLKTYVSNFSTWKSYAIENKIEFFPANKVEFEVFLIDQVSLNLSWQKLRLVINSVKYFHKLFDCKSLEKLDEQIFGYVKKFARNISQ